MWWDPLGPSWRRRQAQSIAMLSNVQQRQVQQIKNPTLNKCNKQRRLPKLEVPCAVNRRVFERSEVSGGVKSSVIKRLEIPRTTTTDAFERSGHQVQQAAVFLMFRSSTSNSDIFARSETPTAILHFRTFRGTKCSN